MTKKAATRTQLVCLLTFVTYGKELITFVTAETKKSKAAHEEVVLEDTDEDDGAGGLFILLY